jgi:Raf kinase inhibitor-like YbhB/YbcL family protein
VPARRKECIVKLTSNSIVDGEPIAADYALAEPADEGHVTFAGNMNPHLSWTHAPSGSQSFVVTCIDLDALTVADDVNQEDREVPSDLERAEFTHWLLADFPADLTEIEEGSHSTAVTPGERPPTRHSLVCTARMTTRCGSTVMRALQVHGTATTDARTVERCDSAPYRFTVYALCLAELNLNPGFNKTELMDAMDGHILGSASITGTYTTNPSLS